MFNPIEFSIDKFVFYHKLLNACLLILFNIFCMFLDNEDADDLDADADDNDDNIVAKRIVIDAIVIDAGRVQLCTY